MRAEVGTINKRKEVDARWPKPANIYDILSHSCCLFLTEITFLYQVENYSTYFLE